MSHLGHRSKLDVGASSLRYPHPFRRQHPRYPVTIPARPSARRSTLSTARSRRCIEPSGRGKTNSEGDEFIAANVSVRRTASGGELKPVVNGPPQEVVHDEVADAGA